MAIIFSINRIISNDRILYINRIFPIDRIFSINIIFSIDRIFLTISNSEKKKIQKTDNLTVYCLDPQWPSGPLRSNHYSIELIELLLLLEIFLLLQLLWQFSYIHKLQHNGWNLRYNRWNSIKYIHESKYYNNFYQ